MTEVTLEKIDAASRVDHFAALADAEDVWLLGTPPAYKADDYGMALMKRIHTKRLPDESSSDCMLRLLDDGDEVAVKLNAAMSQLEEDHD